MMPNAPLAQTGLPDVTGGFFVLVLLGTCGLIGIVICAVSLFYRKPLFFVLGLLLASPALALLALEAYLVIEDFPRTKSWDLSTDRSVSQMDREPVAGLYFYQGNIRSTIRVSPSVQWSGKASHVTFEASSGKINSVSWDSRSMRTKRINQETKRILEELGFGTQEFDSWYQKVRSGEQRRFSISTEPDTNPKIRVGLNSYSWEEGLEKMTWSLQVRVGWEE